MHAEHGATMVELAFSLPIFLMLVLTGADVARIAFAASGMQFAVSQATRQGILGQHAGGAEGVAAIKNRLIEVAEPLGATISAAEITICNAAEVNFDSVTRCAQQSTGRPGGWIYIELNKPMPILIGQFSIQVKASAIAKNEPYKPPQEVTSESEDGGP